MAIAAAREIAVAPLLSGEEASWADFLGSAVNATLFHDLSFLAYHPKGKFAFQHLVFRRNGEIIAVLPGGLTLGPAGPTFHSPLGASFGGFAVSREATVETIAGLVDALIAHARQMSWAAMEITLPPPRFDPIKGAALSFAVFSGGFRLQHRWLCLGLELDGNAIPNAGRRFRSRQLSYVRAAGKRGMSAQDGGVELLDRFFPVFRDTYARHGVAATHTEAEIQDLATRFPDRVRLHVATLDGLPVAGLLVFALTPDVATTFYICSSAQHADQHGAAFVIADAMDRWAVRGYRHLDFGPSASDMKFNRGVVFFKEGLGSYGNCRDLWRWEAAPAEGAAG